jgi:hypothetical protein
MIVRGGCYYTANAACRPAQRGRNAANDKNSNGKCGFRICLTLPGQAVLATPYTEARPFTPASSLTVGVGALDLTTLSLATSGDTALDTRLFTEDESDAGPLITTKWVGTIIIFR